MMVRLVSCYRYEIRDIKLPIRIQDAMQMQVRIRDIKLRYPYEYRMLCRCRYEIRDTVSSYGTHTNTGCHAEVQKKSDFLFKAK